MTTGFPPAIVAVIPTQEVVCLVVEGEVPARGDDEEWRNVMVPTDGQLLHWGRLQPDTTLAAERRQQVQMSR